MASGERQNSREDVLTDSWEKVHYYQEGSQLTPPNPAMSKPVSHGTMEKLLLEAQREWSQASSRIGSQVGSRVGSCIGSQVGSQSSSRGSPKSPRSPHSELAAVGLGEIQEGQTLPQEVPTDWIWDWSSRPEAQPPGDLNGSKFKHPLKRTGLSLRNTKVLRNGPFSLENLPVMLLTHACTFFFGAAVMFIYLKKYVGWSSVTATTVN